MGEQRRSARQRTTRVNDRCLIPKQTFASPGPE